MTRPGAGRSSALAASPLRPSAARRALSTSESASVPAPAHAPSSTLAPAPLSAPPVSPAGGPTSVWFVLLPQVNLLDLAGAAETFRIAGELGARFELRFVGPAAVADAAVGIALAGARPLPDALPDGALVVLLGTRRSAEDFERPEAHETVRWLAAAVEPHRHRLCTVCAGALLAARAGLLDGRACTTHHALIGRLAREAPRARVLENRIFVQDGPVSTSAGITAGIDLALHLVGELAGAAIAAEVAREMVVYARRAGDDPQLSPWLAHRNHLHPAVHRAQDAVMRDPCRDWSAASMAAAAHVGPRHLARLFAEHAGVRPLDWVARIRVELARQALASGQAASVERAAEAAGFASAHALRRAWRRCREDTPASVREARA